MKQTIDTLIICLMTVFISSLTVYGALGIDPTTNNSQPQAEIKR
jgi:hypothetical protein